VLCYFAAWSIAFFFLSRLLHMCVCIHYNVSLISHRSTLHPTYSAYQTSSLFLPQVIISYQLFFLQFTHVALCCAHALSRALLYQGPAEYSSRCLLWQIVKHYFILFRKKKFSTHKDDLNTF